MYIYYTYITKYEITKLKKKKNIVYFLIFMMPCVQCALRNQEVSVTNTNTMRYFYIYTACPRKKNLKDF